MDSLNSTNDERVRVLIVDDEQVIRDMLMTYLSLEGFSCKAVEDGTVAVEELQRRPYHVVLSDMKMKVMGGLELLSKMNELGLSALCIIMTGFGTVETAIDAMKRGAYDYLLKPFKPEYVIATIRRAIERQRLEKENFRLKEAVSIFKITEAMSRSLSLENILDMVLEATLHEAGADVATLTLKHLPSGKFVERTRKYSKNAQTNLNWYGGAGGVGELNVPAIVELHRQERPLLAHGIRALRYFAQPPQDKRLVSFCSIPLKVNDTVIGMLNAYSYTRGYKFSEGQRRLLQVLSSRAAAAIENAQLYEELLARNERLDEANKSLKDHFRATISSFARALEENDKYTKGHSERVSKYAETLGKRLTLSDAELEKLKWAALMHDIGKLGIRGDMLNKQGKLSDMEKAMFQSHPSKGKRILEPIPFMEELIPGAFCHHEAWDGGGYPQGLMGENIPLFGRIVAIADSYDAMTSDRAYRRALHHDQAMVELERGTGTFYDEKLVEPFVVAIEELRKTERAAGLSVPR